MRYIGLIVTIAIHEKKRAEGRRGREGGRGREEGGQREGGRRKGRKRWGRGMEAAYEGRREETPKE